MKWFCSGKHFNTVSEEPDSYAHETAEEHSRNHPEWRFTGKWENRKQNEEDAEQSWFQMEKNVVGRQDTNGMASNVSMQTADEKSNPQLSAVMKGLKQ